jgi:hypothetical protein
MTTTITNRHRAAWAKTPLDIFVKETWGIATANRLQPEDVSDAIADLISDLLHLALRRRLDPKDILTRAKANFYADLGEE